MFKMKKTLLTFFVITLLSCQKEEKVVFVKNSIAEDLKKVISENGVQALQACCQNCSCSQTIGWGTDYSFPGDNFVRIKNDYYNLNRLIDFEIQTVGTTTKEVRMVLTFPL